jgi:hypothetical protein
MASRMAVSISAVMAAISAGLDVAAGDTAAVGAQDTPDEGGVFTVFHDLPASFCWQ